MKKYQIVMNRTYTTFISLKFPDDGRNHLEIIDKKISTGDEDVWSMIAHEELKQMEVNDESWEIHEVTDIEK
tara:strand:- start:2570 stop:2785 length:216 start_codon:yes stop_codon:yes gene_type:complete